MSNQNKSWQRILTLVIISISSLLMKIGYTYKYGAADLSPKTQQSLTTNSTVILDDDADADDGNEEVILSSSINSSSYNDTGDTNNSISNVMVNHSEQEIIPEVHDEFLQINENSSLADDIINITHVQSESKIIVHLKKSATRYCQQPQLIGRLSGPALPIVSWKQPTTHSFQNTTRYDILVGTYNAPMPGTYFLEIIVT